MRHTETRATKYDWPTKGGFMTKSVREIREESRKSYRALLSTERTIPSESLFRDDIFERMCQGVEGRNEARILRDITPLVCPSAETLAFYGAARLRCLVESTNVRWSDSDPLAGARPKPDFSVGFRRESFSNA